ncbi:Holliday junction resolvase RuvX [Marinobacter sp. BGYM27]|uniref:Holliday junction resolvase RuvX n=1 Tax=unclassified Marinobacter TaxID=83889 RepID=UPI000C372AA9|nr:Holliday junction resolvase RuvX [Marinobacter sp. BGYM27]MBH86526.1 Holliday junction resolvase RuvX [Alteromonadaceae bacterium]MDG5501145.1 Holliday junction resolvase RuvX [Marinobacter sp. BGYM27]|tara:strand:+ start:12232 stop:12654 length:423 start_codon:yes stop_codon:yes gene_type:complete
MPEAGQRRVMAFDFGTRRIGVAVGQEMLGKAQPVGMILARDGVPDWNDITALIEEWQPHLFVVGLPLNMDGSESEMCLRARKFGKRLHGRYHHPYEMMDERLSSYEAKGEVLSGGGSRDFGKHGVDDLAAVLILESWFSS